MKRWHKDKQLMLLRQDFDISFVGRKLSIGKYRKRKPLDCGNAQCMICHSEKILGDPKRNELKNDLKFKEGLDEL